MSRLQETAEEIDFAMNNPETRHLIEATWILRERLVFREEVSTSHSMFSSGTDSSESSSNL
jgi:hypothetical protein